MKCHLNGTPLHLPNNTPLQLAKYAQHICSKHEQFWRKQHFNAPIIRQITDEMWNHLTTSDKQLIIPISKQNR